MDPSPAHLPVYLDHNATTPMLPEVLAAMAPYLTERFANPASGHQLGRLAAEGLELARAQVASLINAPIDSIVFNSGGSEGLNHAIKGLAFAQKSGKRRILYGATEHHAVEDAIRWLERFGYIPEPLPVDDQGVLELDALEQALNAGPALLVAVMWANNEVGTVQPVAEISALCRHFGVHFVCDGVQAAGKLEVEARHADVLALASHKLYGPKGIGALCVQAGVKLEPLVHGAGQERGRRSGTSPVALAVGMGAAAELARCSLEVERQRQGTLRDHFEEQLKKRVGGVLVHAQAAARLPNTSCVSFKGVLAWELQATLDSLGVAMSSGAACRSGIASPSPVLLAMGVPDSQARGGVRFSLGRHTDEAQLEMALQAIERAVRTLRSTLSR